MVLAHARNASEAATLSLEECVNLIPDTSELELNESSLVLAAHAARSRSPSPLRQLKRERDPNASMLQNMSKVARVKERFREGLAESHAFLKETLASGRLSPQQSAAIDWAMRCVAMDGASLERVDADQSEPICKLRAVAVQKREIAVWKRTSTMPAAKEAVRADLRACHADLQSVLSSGLLDEPHADGTRWVMNCLAMDDAAVQQLGDEERRCVQSARTAALRKRSQAVAVRNCCNRYQEARKLYRELEHQGRQTGRSGKSW